MLKKIFKIVAYVFAITSLLMLVSFAVDNNNRAICSSFNIYIQYSGDNYFLDEDDIRREVYSALDTIEGKILQDVEINVVESIISDMEYVEIVHVYRTIAGQINVVAKPRKPIVRIINTDNNSFYMDNNGKLMPFSSRYTSRVPVVFGDIRAVYSPVINLKDYETLEYSKNKEKLVEIFMLAEYIDNDPFWKAFIDQIYITEMGEAELIPKGNLHRIEFGNISDINEKFSKLKVFYKNGLTRVGWQQYRVVNLKFNNQIVCSK